MNPIFLEEGKGPHFSNSPSPFPGPRQEKAASNVVGHLALRTRSPWLSVCCSRFMKMHKGQSFLLHFKQKQSERLRNYTNKKRKKKWRPLL